MNFQQYTLKNCHQASGWVVVIDVCRAFTTAAFGFEAGAREIILTSSVEESMLLRESHPGVLLMGEINALPIPGFDFGNSPRQFDGIDLTGKTLVQRTTSGTQGMVQSRLASDLMAASFVCAKTTADYIRAAHTDQVAFVPTGVPDTFSQGIEDLACADYLSQLILNDHVDPKPFIDRAKMFLDFIPRADLNFYEEMARDLERCLQVDIFRFAMQAKRQNGLLVLKKIQVW
jgi:2-phosphosulfolactate phosphatase